MHSIGHEQSFSHPGRSRRNFPPLCRYGDRAFQYSIRELQALCLVVVAVEYFSLLMRAMVIYLVLTWKSEDCRASESRCSRSKKCSKALFTCRLDNKLQCQILIILSQSECRQVLTVSSLQRHRQTLDRTLFHDS